MSTHPWAHYRHVYATWLESGVYVSATLTASYLFTGWQVEVVVVLQDEGLSHRARETDVAPNLAKAKRAAVRLAALLVERVRGGQ